MSTTKTLRSKRRPAPASNFAAVRLNDRDRAVLAMLVGVGEAMADFTDAMPAGFNPGQAVREEWATIDGDTPFPSDDEIEDLAKRLGLKRATPLN